MKILINISVINKNHRGMGVFTKQIIKELISNNNHEYIFVSGNDLSDEMYNMIKNSKVEYNQVNTPLPIFEQIIVPYLIYKYSPDICWFPSNTFPIISLSKSKYIATICDLIFLKKEIKPKSMYQKIGKYYRLINILLGTKKLDKITSISRTVISEIYQKFHIQEKIHDNQVLYVAQEFNYLEDLKIFDKLQLNRNEKYFYTIAGTAPHKNLDFLVKSFEKFSTSYFEYKLIVSGAKNSKHIGQNGNIIFTQFISEEEKATLIKNAELFIFPSLIEGFGIPLIEGLYYNEKVLVSDIDIFREIGKDYVSYFDPYNENFLTEYFNNSDKLKINHNEAKKYILKSFNVKKTTRKLEEIFDEFR